jgi:hypothetical protein
VRLALETWTFRRDCGPARGRCSADESKPDHRSLHRRCSRRPLPARHGVRRRFPLSAYWPLNEGRGQVVRDWSGHNNNGQLGSTAGVDANDPSWIRGLFFWSSALHFDGDDFVTIPDSTSLEPKEMTVSAWFRGTGSPGRFRYLVAKGSNLCQNASYGLYTGTGGGIAFYVSSLDYGGWTRSPEAPDSVWDGKWHNASGTWDGRTVRLFIDGKEIGTGSQTTTPPDYGTPSGNGSIGGYGGGTCDLALVGDLDEVSIWSKALPVSDIWKRAAVFFAPH